ncbi:MAG: GHMP kinase [Bacteroidetes bacterium]|nr:MAG: GHMP kinase [Bacteroidota bacterium]
MIIRTYSYPRAALVGNPSDGYFGKTIAFVFANYRAQVLLYESPELEIVMQERDRSLFRSVKGLYHDVKQYGYYGGIRLLKATIKKFYEYCLKHQKELPEKNFTVRYETNIPNRLGLAGSSAIITACMKALMKFYDIHIPTPHLANLVLSVETEELGIGAGLQDRVAQAYETPVYMDFNRSVMEQQGYGSYQTLSARLLPPLYIAYRTDLSEGSEVVHNDLRARYNRGEQDVLQAIQQWSDLTLKVKEALEQGRAEQIGPLLDQNFDLRRSIMKLSPENIHMVELARSTGASAKFTGSGGAIIGTYRDKQMFDKLVAVLEAEKIKVINPNIISY